MVIPALAAADAAALLVECALNILVSIPALSNRDLNHLARVDEHTGLCGLSGLLCQTCLLKDHPHRSVSVISRV